MNSYSNIVEYNPITHSTVHEFFATERKEKGEYIDEYGYDNNFIVWDVIKVKNNKYFRDIYVYNIETRKTNKLAVNIMCGSSGKGRIPIDLKISDGRVGWIENDFENRVTKIKFIDLNSGKKETIAVSKFIEKFPKKPMSIFFLEIKNNLLFYDLRQAAGAPKIVVYDITKRAIINEFNSNNDILFHFSAAYNEQEKYLALYAKSNNDDGIYIKHLNNDSGLKIVGFHPKSYLYNDRLTTINNFILYNVQINASGWVIDHYYGEIYDLTSKTMKRYKHAIDIVETKRYFCSLKFDHDTPLRKIHFELYKK